MRWHWTAPTACCSTRPRRFRRRCCLLPAACSEPTPTCHPRPALPTCCSPPPQYATHVPLSGLEKGAVALLSLWGAFRNPWRGDLVAASGETTGLPAIRAMRQRMRASETGRQILAERPLITVRRGRAGLPRAAGRGLVAAWVAALHMARSRGLPGSKGTPPSRCSHLT